jgi:N6-L-threonylcarbamoyladenine synthase
MLCSRGGGRVARRCFSATAASKTPKFILGIETSCDDTCVAIMTETGQIVTSHKHTSLHEEYGGIVPHLAKRQHARYLPSLIRKAMSDAGVSFGDLKAVGVTAGPGLGPCLGVGFRAAKAICSQNQIPLIPVNHVEAHALVSRICDTANDVQLNIAKSIRSETSEVVGGSGKATIPFFLEQAAQPLPTQSSPRKLQYVMKPPKLLPFPFLALVISGGHSILAHFNGVNDIERIGSTRDDACGEAFDKIARMINVCTFLLSFSLSFFSSFPSISTHFWLFIV